MLEGGNSGGGSGSVVRHWVGIGVGWPAAGGVLRSGGGGRSRAGASGGGGRWLGDPIEVMREVWGGGWEWADRVFSFARAISVTSGRAFIGLAVIQIVILIPGLE